MTVDYRPTTARAMAGTIIGLCLLLLVISVVQGGTAILWQYGPWAALIGLIAWAAYWNPRVSVDDGGVHLVNVLRTVDLPWPAIQRIDTAWALTFATAYGRYTAWAAPAQGGLARAARRARTSGDDPAARATGAAAAVLERWESLRDAGHLDNPRLESESAPVTWHWPVITAALALIAVGLAATGLLG